MRFLLVYIRSMFNKSELLLGEVSLLVLLACNAVAETQKGYRCLVSSVDVVKMRIALLSLLGGVQTLDRLDRRRGMHSALIDQDYKILSA